MYTVQVGSAWGETGEEIAGWGARGRAVAEAEAAAALAAAGLTAGAATGRAAEAEVYRAKNGRVLQSVVPWCFRPMTLEELCDHSVALGLRSVELVTPDKFPVLRQRGLVCALTSSHGFAKGFAHGEEHAECLKVLRERIDATAAAGFPSVITFSGFRRGISDEAGTKNMVEGLKKIAGYAEEKKVTLCLEMQRHFFLRRITGDFLQPLDHILGADFIGNSTAETGKRNHRGKPRRRRGVDPLPQHLEAFRVFLHVRKALREAVAARQRTPEAMLLEQRKIIDRKSTRLNSSHSAKSRMPSSA